MPLEPHHGPPPAPPVLLPSLQIEALERELAAAQAAQAVPPPDPEVAAAAARAQVRRRE